MDDREIVLESIKKEMTAAWANLHAFTELFDHSDEKRMQLLEQTAPGFFALVQTAFIENALARLARLMDPEVSLKRKKCVNKDKNENLSFRRLCCLCTGVPDLPDFKYALEQFDIIYLEWHKGKYQSLKNHRNKVQSHNELPTIKDAPPFVTTKLTLEDVRLIKELFRDLWGVLATAHRLLKQSSLIEPTYGQKGLNQLPTAIFPYLSAGLYMKKTLASHPEILDDFAGFGFAEVGRDGITSLIS